MGPESGFLDENGLTKAERAKFKNAAKRRVGASHTYPSIPGLVLDVGLSMAALKHKFPKVVTRALGKSCCGKKWITVLRGDVCSYCNERLEISIDHIVPRTIGGPRRLWHNMTASREKCNRMKTDLSLLHFLERRRNGQNA